MPLPPAPPDPRSGSTSAVRIPRDVPPEHRRFWVLARIAFLVALGAHVAFLGVFLAIGEGALALFNLISVAVWGGCLWAHARGRYRSLGGPAFAELFGHATLATVVLGTASGFHLYLLTAIALPFFVPFYSWTVRWALAALAGVGFAALLVYGAMVPPADAYPPWLLTTFLAANALGIGVVIAAVIATYELTVVRAEAALERAYARTDALLHSILPPTVAERLKESPGTVARRHDEVTVLFADLVGFTALSSRMSPEGVIDLLNRIFSAFDELVADRPVEKIKTIGDAWMAVSGAPEPHADHAAAMAGLALAMRARLQAIAYEEDLPLEIRLGLHSGEAMAGVIGLQKPAYDLWGDTVNTASRMEAEGEPGRIQVSEATRARLDGRFRLERRGEIEIEGKGPMTTWWLEGRREGRSPQALS